jgi:hypothetical protein
MAITTTSPAAMPPAPRWLRDLITARTQYEELLGWPVTVDMGPRRLVLAVGHVLDAVTMPEPLGASVLAELQITMLAGPVVADSDGPRWTFLTDLATASQPDISSDLHAHTVHLVPRSGHVIVPGPSDGEGSSRWVRPPRPHHRLPPWSVVIGTTRRVVNGHLGTAGSS